MALMKGMLFIGVDVILLPITMRLLMKRLVFNKWNVRLSHRPSVKNVFSIILKRLFGHQ